MKPGARFQKSVPTREYHLSSYVMEVTNNSGKDDTRFKAVVDNVRRKANERKFTPAQMAMLENAITLAFARRQSAA